MSVRFRVFAIFGDHIHFEVDATKSKLASSEGTCRFVNAPKMERDCLFPKPLPNKHLRLSESVRDFRVFGNHQPRHQANEKKPVPRTAMFRVVAKLSLAQAGDPHLERPPVSRSLFPPWTVYIVIIPPLHDPTPFDALAPQFFGYYTPDNPPNNLFCSPILLIERCGKPISVDKLSVDDRHECAALLFRLNHAGGLDSRILR